LVLFIRREVLLVEIWVIILLRDLHALILVVKGLLRLAEGLGLELLKMGLVVVIDGGLLLNPIGTLIAVILLIIRHLVISRLVIISLLSISHLIIVVIIVLSISLLLLMIFIVLVRPFLVMPAIIFVFSLLFNVLLLFDLFLLKLFQYLALEGFKEPVGIQLFKVLFKFKTRAKAALRNEVSLLLVVVLHWDGALFYET